MKYPGGKWALADWITGFIPPHHSYLEPFFGSGAVLFTKQLSNIETVNDLDGEVVNLFQVIKRYPEELAREIYLTPYARQIFDMAYTEPPKDEIDRALKFYIRLMMGYGFRTTGEKVGWKRDVQGRERSYAANHWRDLPDVVIQAADRLKTVQIENRPAEELIPQFNYPNVFIYADPPYILNTRHGKQYRCEMTNRDHENLLELLLRHSGPVILSGYETELYNNALTGWHKETHMSFTQTMKKKIEILWMNFEPVTQMQLFI